MSNVFELKRFVFLLKKVILERPIQLLGLMGFTMIASLLLYFIVKSIFGFESGQNLSFIFGLLGGGTFLASFIFNYFSIKANGTSYLTLPASSFEKWLCAVLITGVIFVAVFLLFFRIMDWLFVTSYYNSLDTAHPYYNELRQSVNLFQFDGFVAGKAYLLFTNLTGAMLIGSLYFDKVAFIKVALIVSGIIISGYLLDYVMAEAIFTDVEKALPYYAVFVPVDKDFGKVVLPAYGSNAVNISFQYILPSILWMTPFIRLREKEF